MNDVHWGKFVLGALIVTAVCFISDGFLHQRLIHDQWLELSAQLGVTIRDHAGWKMVYFVVFEAGRGSVSDAVPLAQRALALFTEGQDGRNLAVLRTNLGTLQLQLDPPQLAEAKQNLERAAEEMRSNSACVVDIGRNELAQARAHYLGGDFDIAERMTTRVLENPISFIQPAQSAPV